MVANATDGTGAGSDVGTGLGGAVFIFDGPATFNSYTVIFDGNEADNQGGAIFVNPSSGSAGIESSIWMGKGG